jgi:Putative esterase
MEPDWTRRELLGVAAVVGVAACRRPNSASGVGEFTVRHDGRSVRCLFHRSPTKTVPPLAVVLLHGAGADASQWTDIGLTDAVDGVAAAHPTPLVAIAPDADASGVTPFVLDTLLPEIDRCFAPHGAFGVSGISRGGGQALEIAVAARRRLGSVGLHSPARFAGLEFSSAIAPVFIDAGAADPLQPTARRLAADLTQAGVIVTAMWATGGHNRPYWRRHLRRYLDFHLATHEATT